MNINLGSPISCKFIDIDNKIGIQTKTINPNPIRPVSSLNQKHPNLTPHYRTAKPKTFIFQVRFGYKNKTPVRSYYAAKSKDVKKIQKRREKKTFLRRQMLEEARKLPALGFGSNEKERPFWVFSDETKASLVGTSDFRQRSSGGDASSGCGGRFGVERVLMPMAGIFKGNFVFLF